ncbi:MAG: beta-ketoacyl synthase N-terminal-like domain-containing protein [Brachymonas sp.]|nr:beta-ketoacyl synthase N-terminal-like domain-containing protein [Brachymonas sp.]
MPSLQPVYLAGLGHCSARGLSAAAAASAMLAGQTAHDWRQIAGERSPYFRMPLQGRWLQRAEAAVRACVADLRAAVPVAQWRNLPVFFASSSFQVGLYETPDWSQPPQPAAQTTPADAAIDSRAAGAVSVTAVTEKPIPTLPPGAASFAVQCMQWLGVQGLPQCVSHACTSSMLALEAAANWLAHGWSQHALVIATECDNRLTANGFHSLGLLSPDACRPLAANRNGFVLGEAVAAVLLSTDPGLGQGLNGKDGGSESGNKGRSEIQPWRLAAWASATDMYSLTGPDPSGQPIAAVLQAALQQAGLRAADIDLLKLHAAGVGSTDAAEARALQQVFGTQVPPLLSLKPYLGHTLGASTLAEITALLACLQQGQIPATPGCEQPDAELGLLPVRVRQALQPRHVLAVSLGFGGSVAACILSRGGA